MKKTIVCGILMLLAIVSCKKETTYDPDGVRGTIYAKINGTATDFNYGENMIMGSLYDYSLGGDYYYIWIYGESKNANRIDIDINSLSPITPGTYPCSFTPLDIGVSFKNYGATPGESYYTPFRDSNGREYKEGSITITEITDGHVKGRFNAMARRDTISPVSLMISEGSFDFLR